MSEDMWHVEMEPGDVKVVTLEQMDDMYRLDIIQGSTKVWQQGMPRALPLSVVAGIDEVEEEEEEIMEIEPEPLDSAPILNVAASVAPPPPASAPPPRSTITPPPSSSVATSQPPPAPALPSPDFYSPQSLRPITMSGTPHAPAGTGTGGRIVMVLALAAGLVMTLYRNDLLLTAAQSAGSEAAYESVESTFGQPGFGTTRSVEQLAALVTPEEATDVSGTSTTSTTTSTTTAATETSESKTPASAPKTAEQSDASAAAKGEKAEPKPSQAPTRAKPRAVHRPAKKKSLKRFKGSEYDPMNASL